MGKRGEISTGVQLDLRNHEVRYCHPRERREEIIEVVEYDARPDSTGAYGEIGRNGAEEKTRVRDLVEDLGDGVVEDILEVPDTEKERRVYYGPSGRDMREQDAEYEPAEYHLLVDGHEEDLHMHGIPLEETGGAPLHVPCRDHGEIARDDGGICMAGVMRQTVRNLKRSKGIAN